MPERIRDCQLFNNFPPQLLFFPFWTISSWQGIPSLFVPGLAYWLSVCDCGEKTISALGSRCWTFQAHPCHTVANTINPAELCCCPAQPPAPPLITINPTCQASKYARRSWSRPAQRERCRLLARLQPTRCLRLLSNQQPLRRKPSSKQHNHACPRAHPWCRCLSTEGRLRVWRRSTQAPSSPPSRQAQAPLVCPLWTCH